MLIFSSNGKTSAAIKATMVLRRVGAWTADVTLNTTDVPSGKCGVTAGDTSFAGFVVRSRLHHGVVEARLVAGAGGLGKTARPKPYHSPLLRHVMADLMRDSGETLSASSTPAATAFPLQNWTTMGVSTGMAIWALAEAAGATWRVLPDGSIWVGHETWPASKAEYQELEEDPPNATELVAVAVPNLLPGTTIEKGRKIDIVQHEISADSCRTRIWFTGE